MPTNLHDYAGNALAAETFAPASRTADADGAQVDLARSNDGWHAILHVGAVSGSNPTLDVKIQESKDGGTTWTDVPEGAFPQVTAPGLHLLTLHRASEPTLRGQGAIGGTTPDFVFGCIIAGQKKST